MAYVSQKAWMQNATVKENILFGQPFDSERYEGAVHFSCLASDVEVLVNGDQTVIGEKGVNLSGGQKARVALARALYQDSDIYLLDDPISAVDAHVGRFIMQATLGKHLHSKTRVLVTHALPLCQFADYIYVLQKGEIVQEGTFEQLQMKA